MSAIEPMRVMEPRWKNGRFFFNWSVVTSHRDHEVVTSHAAYRKEKKLR